MAAKPDPKDPVAPIELGALDLPLVDVDLLSKRCHLENQVAPGSKAVSQARQPIPEESQHALVITHDRMSVKHPRFPPGTTFAEHGYHQGIGGQLIAPRAAANGDQLTGAVRRRTRLRGLLSCYYREAA
jgi:hypothetical protein